METPIVLDGSQILVPVQIGYDGLETEVMLVLDTGSSTVAIFREVAEKLGIEEVEKSKVRFLGGAVADTEAIVLSHVKVGPVTKTGLRALIIDHDGRRVDHSGLLGMNFLRDLHYSIDYSDRVIRWQKGDTP
jgi:clan AA aspartic protease (TIGR02281 family)